MKVIDARGLACPAPVLMARDAVETDADGRVKVIVNDRASKENVSLFLESRGFHVSVDERDGDFHITGEGGPGAAAAPSAADLPDADLKKIMVMVTTDRMGYGDDTLGLKLMLNFIKTLREMGSELWRLVLVNNGVKLAVTGSAALEDLNSLAAAGVTILVCGTCLTHFDLLHEKQVGETTNMLDIVTAMQLADKVVNI
ncbi:sulfurtransferase-like selenium metabolism protein YedF [Desulfococcus multivorans]|jgi:selenium metabolism protein YedF|uniref:Selenium metabolism protein YedF n=1 Tax=Desulfococcus multivorans DSM 2059 TaxID=1121405 RepID=S7TM52_DESML|nr:sulfurtransferase-like selenium metabolism protein YedF [Desulfococcus multivorans]AOY58294.1 SirA family protein [Desulfococcus multivorans]AQV00632.1 SirA family protein [Desulfococcus multivorans]EPR37765.1 selenium metabolism protein YedF [Desulfococcus multivorans DSM 2059]MDX9818980.1 sulfurtransferase-like selenium metabolism protein YedF [Desulfococcus multivorans]SJZ98270.1 selenium metabolism protein YedF [Desulfococcus multivorans DSM 2059]